jgi:integrase
LYDDLRGLLERIPRRATTILTSTAGRPWKTSSLESAVWRAKRDAGLGDRNLHFHDLRGTAATKFYTANIPIRVIAEILGWTEDSVDDIIRKYVGRAAATKALIRQINEAKNGT